MKKAFLVAAASSGSGKTTLTIGLLRAFRNKGYKVQPFKCGPDYIDPLYHRIACDKDSVNLDTWMRSEQEVQQTFLRYSQDTDICIVEGMMYLSQGIDQTDMVGLLPFRTTMKDARLHLGYRSMQINEQELRGHEFHYSSIMGTPPASHLQLYDAQGQPVDTGFFVYGNVYAGYTHWIYPDNL